MAINKLTLRTVNSPYVGNAADFTKNSVLTHKEVDNNFVFLKGEDIITGSTSGTTLILTQVNNDIIEVDLLPILCSVDNYTTGATVVGSSLYFDTTDTLSAYTVDLSSFLDNTNDYVTGSTLIGTTLYFNRTDALSAFTVDLSSISGDTNTDNFTTGSTIIGSTVYFDRTNSLSAYTLDLSSISTDTNYYTTGSTVIGATAYLDRTDSLSAYTIDLSSFTADTNYYATGSTLVGTTIYFDRTDSLSAFTTDLSSINTDNYTTGATVVGSSLYFDRTNSLSAYTIDLSSVNSGDTNYYTTGSTIIGATAYFDRTDTLSAYTMDLSPFTADTDTNYYTTGSTVIGATAYFDRTDTLSAYTIDLSSFTADTDTNYYTTGSTVVGTTLYFDRTDGLSAYTADLSSINTDNYTTGATLINNSLYFDRTDSLSAYTIDLSSVNSGDTNYYTTGATVIGTTAYFDRTDTLSAYTLELSSTTIDNAVSVTYNELTGLTATNSLVPGTWYQFEYSTKHLIGGTVAEYNDTSVHYDDGTGVKSTYTAETETLSVLALSGNVIHVEAKSTQYPNDKIYYDINDNKTEDGLQDRPGFIIYREDTINSISAHYDWRNVLHRRFDTDPSSARTSDFQTMLGYDAVSDVNHPILNYMVPAFVPFSSSGTTDIGPLNTATEGTYRDFKTFVGLDTDVFAGPDTKGRYLNIHIDNSDSQARIIGSGIGVIIPDENTLSSNLYGNIANVVFFTRSAENVNIGRNCSGVMIAGKTIKDVTIGDNNENVILGGFFSAPTYNGTTATTKNYCENIEIGNNNRNVMIGGANRRVTIGNNNTGVVFQAEATDNTLGSYNTLVYSWYSNNNNLGDWMTNIRISHSSNITLKNECQNIDLIQCGVAGQNTLFQNGATTATFPDGFDLTSSQTNLSSSSASYIGDRGTNILVYTSQPFRIESQAKNIIINRAGATNIGSLSENITIFNSKYTNIGKDVDNVEVFLGDKITIDDGCTGIKLNTSELGTHKIGKDSSNIGIYMGSTDVEIGEVCSNIFVSGTGVKTKIGNYNSNVTCRNSSYVTIGNYNDEIFLEGSSWSTIGNYNSDISLADVGMVYKPGFPSFTTYSWLIEDAKVGRDYSGRIFVTGGTAPFNPGNDWAPSLGTWNNSGFTGCFRTTVGNNCDNVFIVRSNDCVIGNNTTNVDIGCQTTTASTYTLGNVSGYMNSIELTGNTGYDAVTAATVTIGKECHNTVIGSNCDLIEIRGVGQTGNTFYDNVTGVEAVSGFTFTDNRVLVDGNNVTTTASYTGVTFDKNSPDGNRWEYGIDNAGAFLSSTKLQ